MGFRRSVAEARPRARPPECLRPNSLRRSNLTSRAGGSALSRRRTAAPPGSSGLKGGQTDTLAPSRWNQEVSRMGATAPLREECAQGGAPPRARPPAARAIVGALVALAALLGAAGASATPASPSVPCGLQRGLGLVFERLERGPVHPRGPPRGRDHFRPQRQPLPRPVDVGRGPTRALRLDDPLDGDYAAMRAAGVHPLMVVLNAPAWARDPAATCATTICAYPPMPQYRRCVERLRQGRRPALPRRRGGRGLERTQHRPLLDPRSEPRALRSRAGGGAPGGHRGREHRAGADRRPD